MSSVNFQRTYVLGEAYESVKEDAIQVLGKYLSYPELISFDEVNRSITFSTERLIPAFASNRPRVMLLFSNPHPHSIRQGMFLSPNPGVNPFWPAMREAEWLVTQEGKLRPEQLADICLRAEYRGPFELIFYCYYAFPTERPEDLRRLFGNEYLNHCIEPEAARELTDTIDATSAEAVVAFNKRIFNLVSRDPVERYVEHLQDGALICSQIKGIDRYVPIFLTFPTGWRYHKQYKQIRSASLTAIKAAICDKLKLPKSENA